MDDDLFLFQADTFEEKEGWIDAIGKAMIKGSKSNLYISKDDNM